MNWFVKWIAKKYVVSLINDALDAAKNNDVDIPKYSMKIRDIMSVLTEVCDVLKDNKVTKDEAEKIIEKTTELFK